MNVQPSATRDLFFQLPCLAAQTINLNTYEGGFVWWWSFAGFLLGVAWMLYWTLSKRTVTNLAVTLQLPVNDDAPDIGLITPKDHVWMNVAGGTDRRDAGDRMDLHGDELSCPAASTDRLVRVPSSSPRATRWRRLNPRARPMTTAPTR